MSAGHFIIPEDIWKMSEDGWGPLESLEAGEPPLLPYQPYSKTGHVGHVSDWNHSAKYTGVRFTYGKSAQGEAVQTFAFTYKEEEEDDSFRAVGRASAQQKKRATSYYNTGSRARSGRGGGFHATGRSGMFGAGRGGRGGGRGGFHRSFVTRNWGDSSRLITESTITVGPSWEKKEIFAFSTLQKSLFGVVPGTNARDIVERLLPPVPKATDIEVCGQLNLLKPAMYQMASCKKPITVKKSTKLSFNVSTSDDPVINRIADKIRAEGTEKTIIFATDNIIAVLMTAPRSILPWGISAVRDGNFIFLDVSDDSILNLLTVNETDAAAGMDTQDSESPNSPSKLWREASYVSDMYAQHIVDAEHASPALKFDNPCPFLTEEDKTEGKEAAPVAYRYRRFVVSENVDVIVRCELQALKAPCARDSMDANLVTICTLNEWNPSVTKWASMLDTRSGLTLATEVKNNSCRMTRVTAKAILSGVNQVHIGFVTRKSAKDNTNHMLLTTAVYSTNDFARQISVTERNLWGIADTILQKIVPLPEGRYLITKQDSSPNITIYSTPEEEPDPTA